METAQPIFKHTIGVSKMTIIIWGLVIVVGVVFLALGCFAAGCNLVMSAAEAVVEPAKPAQKKTK
jgi:hypothetical protein